jgi:hypothetical protein
MENALGYPAPCLLLTAYCSLPTAFCLLFHRFQFRPGDQQWLGNLLEFFEFPRRNIDASAKHTANSLRKKLAR